jgi:signal transduction histidine kinase
MSTLTGYDPLPACDISIIEALPREAQEKRLEIALDSIGDGILAVDTQRKAVIINRVAKHILELPTL